MKKLLWLDDFRNPADYDCVNFFVKGFFLFLYFLIFKHCNKAITGIKDHADYWEELKSTGQLGIVPENLREEYFSIPRGRVVYHEDRDFFTLYHGNNLTKHDLQKVAAAFCLPKEKTRFEKDIHYCDLQDDEWEQMFV